MKLFNMFQKKTNVINEKQIQQEQVDLLIAKIESEHRLNLEQNGYVFIEIKGLLTQMMENFKKHGETFFNDVADNYTLSGEPSIEFHIPSKKQGFTFVYEFDLHTLHPMNIEYRFSIKRDNSSLSRMIAINHAYADEKLLKRVRQERLNTIENVNFFYPFNKRGLREFTMDELKYVMFTDMKYKSWMDEVSNHLNIIQEKMNEKIESINQEKK